jgi:Flp pilus assembly protein TadG
MPSPAGSTAITLKLLRRFRRNRRGSAAVEFALIATPFFALLFAIIETSIVFFAGQVLETGVQDSARLIYTHQFQDSSGALTKAEQQAKFKTDLCTRVSVLLNCNIIDFDVKFYAAGTPITIVDPIDGTGNYNNAGFDFVTPPSGSTATVVVRAFYQWPLYVTGLGYNIANIGRNTSNKRRLLAATAAFHVEP